MTVAPMKPVELTINPALKSVFNSKALDYQTERTRIAIEDSISRYLGQVHKATFKDIRVTSVHIAKNRSNTSTVFTFAITEVDKKDYPSYEPWSVIVDIRPFMANYDEWMYGGKEIWKEHVKPHSR